MKHIQILKDATYSAKIGGSTISGVNETNLLADGAVAIFTNTGVMVTASTTKANISTAKSFYIAVGSGDATKGAQITMHINRRFLIKKTAYVAPVKKVSFIGYEGSVGASNLPASPVTGTIASVYIVDNTDTPNNVVEPKNKKLYEYTVQVGDDEEAILDGLIALINADTNAAVVAAAVVNTDTVGIQLTAKDFGQNFIVSTRDILADADIYQNGEEDSIEIVYGNGTPAQIRQLEIDCEPHEGKGTAYYFPTQMFSKASRVVSNATYTVYDFTYETIVPNSVNTNYGATAQHQIVAVPSGAATLITALDTIFGVLVEVL
jgi:hypothetical protein